MKYFNDIRYKRKRHIEKNLFYKIVFDRRCKFASQGML